MGDVKSKSVFRRSLIISHWTFLTPYSPDGLSPHDFYGGEGRRKRRCVLENIEHGTFPNRRGAPRTIGMLGVRCSMFSKRRSHNGAVHGALKKVHWRCAIWRFL